MNKIIGLPALLLFTVLLLFATGARCVERDTVRRDRDGNIHIYGELFNETGVQGVDIGVEGSLFDAAGELLASATAFTCPGELSPGKPVVYDIAFEASAGLPNPASHKVNVARGAARPAPLPELTTAPVVSVRLIGSLIHFKIELAPQPGIAGEYYMCGALYDSEGNVVGVPLPQRGIGNPAEGIDSLLLAEPLPGAVSARVWVGLWAPGGLRRAASQPFVTGLIPISASRIPTPIGER